MLSFSILETTYIICRSFVLEFEVCKRSSWLHSWLLLFRLVPCLWL